MATTLPTDPYQAFDEFTDALFEVIPNIAVSITRRARSFSLYYDVDDVTQELWVLVNGSQRPNFVAAYADGGTAYLGQLLKQVLTKRLDRERRALYPDWCVYNFRQCEELVALWFHGYSFSPSDWETLANSGGGGNGFTASSDERREAFADLATAWRSLGTRQAEAVILRTLIQDESWDTLALRTNGQISGDALRKNYSRGIDRLVQLMSGTFAPAPTFVSYDQQIAA